MKLKTKLIILYIFTIVVPLLIIGEIILSVSGNLIVDQTVQVTQESAKQTHSNVKDLLLQYLEISNRLSNDQKLKEYLTPHRTYTDVLDVMNAYEEYLYPVVNYESRFKSMEIALKIYFQNLTLLQNVQTYIFADDTVKRLEEYSRAKEMEGENIWGHKDKKVYLSRMIKDLNDNSDMYVISLFISEEKLYSLISQSKDSDRIIIISDENGYVLSSNDRSRVNTSIKGTAYFDNIMKDKNIQIFNYKDDIEYKVLNNYLGNSKGLPDWNIITMIPTDTILKEEGKIKKFGLVICIVTLLLSCIIFVIFLEKITNRIKLLARKMKDINSKKFSIIEDDGSEDEIGTVTRSFNFMAQNLQELIFENYETNIKMKDISIKKQEAEMYALQSQISPHFLFNTLESLRMELINVEDRQNAKLVLHLSRLLRKSLNWQGEIIFLHEELDFVKSYLEIIKYRFSDRVSYEIDIEEDLEKCKIPKLTIQPIVENAVKHGIEPLKGKAKIEIHASSSDELLIIRVRDNGIGMDEGTLNKIRKDLLESMEIKKTGSLGMRNVNDRILLHYGNEFGLHLESKPGEGTEVIIKFPIIK